MKNLEIEALPVDLQQVDGLDRLSAQEIVERHDVDHLSADLFFRRRLHERAHQRTLGDEDLTATRAGTERELQAFDVLTSRSVAKLVERLPDRLQADDSRFGKRRSEPECGLPDVGTDVDDDRGVPHRSSDVRDVQDAVTGTLGDEQPAPGQPPKPVLRALLELVLTSHDSPSSDSTHADSARGERRRRLLTEDGQPLTFRPVGRKTVSSAGMSTYSNTSMSAAQAPTVIMSVRWR